MSEDERKMRGRKEERWFNRTRASKGDVKAGTKSDGRRLRERKKKTVADEGGRMEKGGDRIWLLHMWGVAEKGKDAGFKKKGIKRGIYVRNEQLRGRERNGKNGLRPRLPQDCANPSNPDTS